MPSTRVRATIALLATVLAATALTACAPSEEGGENVATGDPGAFPVTVEHAYGETTVASQPTRIVSVGYTEQDTLWALGLKPVGVTDWYGGYDFASWPWADEARGDSEPEVLSTSDGFDFEAIALLDPDLIIGTNAGLTEEDYDRLSDIAPTVAHAGDYSMYFAPWDGQTLQIGGGGGREEGAGGVVGVGGGVGVKEEGRQLGDDIDAQFAEAAEAHPEFAGKSIVFL